MQIERFGVLSYGYILVDPGALFPQLRKHASYRIFPEQVLSHAALHANVLNISRFLAPRTELM